jgi:hypothetical protein
MESLRRQHAFAMSLEDTPTADRIDPKTGRYRYELSDAEQASYGYGIAFDRVEEDEDGRLWIDNGEYVSQVNYCPMTGRPARVKIGEEDGAMSEQDKWPWRADVVYRMIRNARDSTPGSSMPADDGKDPGNATLMAAAAEMALALVAVKADHDRHPSDRGSVTLSPATMDAVHRALFVALDRSWADANPEIIGKDAS